MRIKRTIATLPLVMATLFTGAVGAVVATGTPALATSCIGASCIGQDPQSTGCATGARIEESQSENHGGTSYNLVYSPHCQTYWGLFVSNIQIQTATTKIIVVKQCFRDGYYACGTYSKIAPIEPNVRASTLMVASLSSTERFRACDPDTADSDCLPWWPNS